MPPIPDPQTPDPPNDPPDPQQAKHGKALEWVLLGLAFLAYLVVFLSLVWMSPVALVVGLMTSLVVAAASLWVRVKAGPVANLRSARSEALFADDPIKTTANLIWRWVKKFR